MIKAEYHDGMVSVEISGKIIDIAHELATVAMNAYQIDPMIIEFAKGIIEEKINEDE